MSWKFTVWTRLRFLESVYFRKLDIGHYIYWMISLLHQHLKIISIYNILEYQYSMGTIALSEIQPQWSQPLVCLSGIGFPCQTIHHGRKVQSSTSCLLLLCTVLHVLINVPFSPTNFLLLLGKPLLSKL